MTPTKDDGRHPDELALERIAHALDQTLFVVAGAGSGKTRALVTRLRNLVTEGKVPMRAIAAITFTEKAAGELRERARAELQRVASDGNGAAQAALDELDGAAIGTLHSFAHRILNEHPIEVGLPPAVEVLDEVGSTVLFEQRWGTFLDRLLDDPRFARPLLLLTASGVKPDALKEITISFNQNWDLVEAEPFPEEGPPEWQPQLSDILARVDEVCAQRGLCNDGNDPLYRLLDAYATWAEQIRSATDEGARLELLQVGEGLRPKANPNGKGAKTRWSAECDLKVLRAEMQSIKQACETLSNDVAHGALLVVAAELRRFTLASAEERRREGRLEFHDLLVLTRRLLRHPSHGAAVRRLLRERYQRLLIDEFQDTDPIQVELAVLLAAADPTTDPRSWQAVETEAGRLFFVGDPKQSIYRFRRADIGLYLQVAERFAGPGTDGADQALTLAANHRSGETLIEWLNATFASVMHQPGYIPSVSRRANAPGGPHVAIMSRQAHDDSPRAGELRRREALDVAAVIGRTVAEGWPVQRSTGPGDPRWEPARPGDIAVLIPDRQPLTHLEDALTEAGIPFRTESASLVYSTRLVRDLFTTLRAVDDPSDEHATVTALRSPLFGCGDDDLLTFRQHHGGRFDYSRLQPDSVPEEHPVALAFTYLRQLHQRRHWMAPSEVLDHLIRDRRAFELAVAEPTGRARDLWHRLRFITDQARAWSDTTGGTLRQYLEWARRQTGPTARVSEAVLPETDDDAVRIMTIHAAKGLEFPIAIVAGLSTRRQARPAAGRATWTSEGTCVLAVGAQVRSPAYEAWRPIDEQMSHDERVRLLYVACSRARDHLVVSLHRTPRSGAKPDPARMTSAELLVDAMGPALDTLPDGPPPPDQPPARDRRPTAPEPEPERRPVSFSVWQRERADALARSGAPHTIAATTLNQEGIPDQAADPGLHKRPRDLDLPPWRKGRYGTAIGRAVHGTLQVIDLATGHDLAATVKAQAVAEGLSGPGDEEHIARLVRAAIDSPLIQAAAQSEHWKEVHVATPLDDDRTLEGYIDLLFRRADGALVIVDYKTGPRDPGDDIDELVAHYRIQGASYAWAIGEATGTPPAEMTFLFLTPGGAISRPLVDLPTAMEDARQALELGGRH